MNSYILNRQIGSISPSAFHVAQTSRLAHLIEPAPGIRFNSRKRAAPRANSAVNDGARHASRSSDVEDVSAHTAGVNVLAIDQYDGR